jgi:hypothetical protein
MEDVMIDEQGLVKILNRVGVMPKSMTHIEHGRRLVEADTVDEKWQKIGVETLSSEDCRYLVDVIKWISTDSPFPMTEHWLNGHLITCREYDRLQVRPVVHTGRTYLSLNRKAAVEILTSLGA